MTDIVERLRLYADEFPIKDTGKWIDFASLYLAEGADEIERLRAEVRLIIEERDCTFHLMLHRTEKAETEVERLREALKRIEALPGEINPSNYDHDDVVALNNSFIEAFQIARAALEGE